MRKSKSISLVIILAFALCLISCEPEPEDTPDTSNLPHLRYVQSALTGDGATTYELHEIDLNNMQSSKLWEITDTNIDRVELTPDGEFVLVHYSIIEELNQYYVVYNLNLPDTSTPVEFIRGDETTEQISAYQAFLDEGTYRYGFVIGDPDFELYMAEGDVDVYQFAWVNLAAGLVENIPLMTNMKNIPDIIYVPPGAGTFDFLPRNIPQIIRLNWSSVENEIKHIFFEPMNEPRRQIKYIGSFSWFADFRHPGPDDDFITVKPGLVTIKDEVELRPGDFPLWSLNDNYILIRIFPPEIIQALNRGEDSVKILDSMASQDEDAKFALYDVRAGERREISLELSNPLSMPRPVYDPESGLLAAKDFPWIGSGEDDDSEISSDSYSIIIFDVAKDQKIISLDAIPFANGADVVFYRPEKPQEPTDE
jgi:hypothetical protein